MTRDAYMAYTPLATLKPFAEQLWIVDGPEIRMNYLGIKLPFPTRMTIVRLPSGDLWVHSPIAPDDALVDAIHTLGPVRHLIAPNTLHYWYIPEWQARFPNARSYGAPGLAKNAKRPLTLDETLGAEPPPAWEGAFDQCVAPGTLLTEVDFFHLASRTLILTDLIENFEPNRVRNPLLRWIMKWSGAADPDGKAPIDMQWSFRRHRREMRAAYARMIAWAPERIVIAHGRCYETDGMAELRRAFRWVT